VVGCDINLKTALSRYMAFWLKLFAAALFSVARFREHCFSCFSSFDYSVRAINLNILY
jgi:hypothetical protein